MWQFLERDRNFAKISEGKQVTYSNHYSAQVKWIELLKKLKSNIKRIKIVTIVYKLNEWNYLKELNIKYQKNQKWLDFLFKIKNCYKNFNIVTNCFRCHQKTFIIS